MTKTPNRTLILALTSARRAGRLAAKIGRYALVAVSVGIGLCALVVASALYGLTHLADSRETWPNDPYDFFSTDMRPVKVEFIEEQFDKTNEPVRFEIPRAWIAFAGGYSPGEFDQVPDLIQTWMLEIWLSEPDGVPLSNRVSEIVRFGKTYKSEARDSLRADEYKVSFWRVDPAMTAEQWRSRFQKSATVERDGRQYDPHRMAYMPNGTNDAFIEADCTGRPPNIVSSNAIPYCRYIVRVSPQLMAAMTFLDFRYDHGIDFANARIRRALGVFCRQSPTLCMTAAGPAN